MPKECEIRYVQTTRKGNYDFYMQQFIDGEWRSIPMVDPNTGMPYPKKDASQ
jgi:hypothetical protein